MELVELESRVLQLKFDFPQPKQLNNPIEQAFNKLIAFNNKLCIYIFND